ncbi:Hypothetical_protein [Hexamita inflata]|uniref:Hypothetical_protein n=1 Tax=Hexamita inflata TaxID=28002 RepID=A0AA86QBF4_9EUKA|nr:Hypothetical protein HINF_LOCUS39743 [Hexamita inflata]
MNCVVAYFDDKLGPRIVFSSKPDDYNNSNLAYCLLPPGCHFFTEDSFFTSYEGNFYYAQLFQIPSDAQRPLRTYSVSISSPIFEKVLHFSVKVTELALGLAWQISHGAAQNVKNVRTGRTHDLARSRTNQEKRAKIYLYLSFLNILIIFLYRYIKCVIYVYHFNTMKTFIQVL